MNFIDDSLTGAVFSPCRKWRYSLWRRWEACEVGEMCAFVCLNPSTADEIKPDPTVTRCINFSKEWGFGGFIMLNLFAWRATDPADMKAAADPVGPDNDACLKDLAHRVGMLVTAWGTDGGFRNRQDYVLREILHPELYETHYLKKTKQGFPWHPLYIRADTKPQLW